MWGWNTEGDQGGWHMTSLEKSQGLIQQASRVSAGIIGIIIAPTSQSNIVKIKYDSTYKTY